MSSQANIYSYLECSHIIDVIKHTLSKYVNQLQPISEYRRKYNLLDKIELLIDPLEDFQQGVELLNRHYLIWRIIEESNNKLIYQLKNSLILIIYIKQLNQSWGVLNLTLTGNQNFLDNITKLCHQKGYDIVNGNLIDTNNNLIISIQTEEDLFKLLNLEYVKPESRNY